MSNRVLFLEPPRADVDVSSALKHGKRVDLYAPVSRGRGSQVEGGANARPSRPSVMDFEHFVPDVVDRLLELDYDPWNDALVMTGATLPLALLFAAVAVRWKCFKVLVFAANHDAYVMKEFDSRWVAQVVV